MDLKKSWHRISSSYWFVVIIYALFGILWIALSDYILLILVPNRERLAQIQTWKGWFFILVTSLLLLSLTKRHHEQILRRGMQQDKIMMAMSIPIVITSYHGSVKLVNQAFMDTFGYTRKEIPTTEDWFQKAYPDPEYRQQVMNQWQGDTGDEYSVSSSNQMSKIFKVMDKWGKEHTVEFILIFQEFDIFVLCHDITEKMQHQEQMIQEEKMRALGQLAGGVAHDFNNQLCIIMGYAELLESHMKDEEAILYLQNVVDASETSSSLIKQLSSFSRTTKTNMTPVDFEVLLEEVVDMGKHTFPERIHIELEVDCPSSQITGNEGMLKSMILNLMINARDAMPQGGRLKLSLRQAECSEKKLNGMVLSKGRYLLFGVSDQGIGMNKTQISRIFEPFFTTKGMIGSGMGLAMVFGTVEKHRGAIEVESKVGKGSRFTIYLPLS